MINERVDLDATIRDRFLETVARRGRDLARELEPLAEAGESLDDQREDAWRLLSEGVKWAAMALDSVGVNGTDISPIGDSEAAFDRGQHLDAQVFKLSQLPQRNDRVALLVDAVKQACYSGADLGPLRGGGIGTFKAPDKESTIAPTVQPQSEDLQAVGDALGEALLRLGDLHLGDPAKIASSIFAPATV
jgi:hypothetical protein